MKTLIGRLSIFAAIALATFGYGHIALGEGTGTLTQLPQWVGTSSPYSAITPSPYGKNIYAPASSATTSNLYTSLLQVSGLGGSGTRCLQVDNNGLISKAAAACGSGGGSGGGSWSTTTSSVASQLINYPNNDTDIVVIGGSSTTTAPFWYDPNTTSFLFRSSSTTIPGLGSGILGLNNGRFYAAASTTLSTITGTLAITQGGTGLTSITGNRLLYTNSAGSALLEVATSSLSIGGNAATASALLANGANCSSGSAPLGVDSSGAVESCFDVWTEAENTSAAYAAQATTLTVAGTANQITSSAGAQSLAANRTWTLSLPNHVIFPANFQATSASTTNATSTAMDITNLLTFGGVTGNSWDDYCVSITGSAGLCDGSDATGAGGSGTVSTSTNETAGRLSYWTSTSGTPALLGEVATTTLTVSGFPANIPATLGALVGGSNTTWTWWGLATTSALTQGHVLYNTTGGNGVAGVATSSQTLSNSFSTTGTLGNFLGGTSGTLSGITYFTFSVATTSTWTGTTTIPLGPAYVGETLNGIQCFTDTGTLNVDVYYDSTHTALLNASTTVGTFTWTTNNTPSAANKRYVDIGTPASSPRYVSCTVKKTI